MSIEKKPSPMAQRLLLTPIRQWIESRSEIVIERNDTAFMKPPYVIVSNHVNNWDPLFINCYVNEPICFIAGEPLFRNPFLRPIIEYTGAIRKTKFTNDTSTIRNVLKAKKHNRVIGIFPEGNRNWDGINEPLIYSTSKLIKLLKIPVVVAKIKGGYLSHPRWGDGHRKGKIAISFEKLWDPEEIELQSIDHIHQHLTESMYHNEMIWQDEHSYTYTGKNTAHYLERLLFVCPNCHSLGNMYSSGNTFSCQSCHYQVNYTPTGTFQSSQKLYFNHPHDWKKWQLEFINQHFEDPAFQTKWKNCLKDPVKLYISKDKKPFQLFGKGELTWDKSLFHFNSSKHQIDIDISQAEGINIQFHHKLDFLYEGDFYRMVFYEPRSSTYKWLQIAKKIKSKEEYLRGMIHG